MIYAFFLLGINLLSFVLFGIDKRQSIIKGRRVSEAALLAVMILGGAVGGMFGMAYFRHKTKKFKAVPFVIIVLQSAALAFFAYRMPITQ